MGQPGVETLADCRRGECGLCALDVVELHGTIDHPRRVPERPRERRNDRLCACMSRVAGGGAVLDTARRNDS
jgi:vanillate O-demethylase ferredoxin subunit